jgi:hypothetical protein
MRRRRAPARPLERTRRRLPVMRRARLGVLAAALGAGTLCPSQDAYALGPVDLEAAAKVGMGTDPWRGPNPLGPGLGMRAGVSFMGLYGGLNIVYYFGSSENVLGPGINSVGVPVTISQHSLLYGVEAGYGVKLSRLTLRAQIGVGNATVMGSNTGDSVTNAVVAPGSWSNNYLYLEPGVIAMVSLGRWFVGADVNALILTGFQNGSSGSSTGTALMWHGQVGITF